MARISRKELKKDEFVQEVESTFEFFAGHRQQAVVFSAVVGGILLVALGAYLLWDKRTGDASDSLSRAIKTFHAELLPPGVPAPPNSDEKFFSSDKEKYTAALKEYQAIADKYSLLKQSGVARYYVALCQLKLGNIEEGRKGLEALAAGRDQNLGSMARFALASELAAEGKIDEAEKLYRYLIEHPSAEVPKPISQMALAIHLRPTKPGESEKLYRDLELNKANPRIPEMAKRMLEELKQ